MNRYTESADGIQTLTMLQENLRQWDSLSAYARCEVLVECELFHIPFLQMLSNAFLGEYRRRIATLRHTPDMHKSLFYTFMACQTVRDISDTFLLIDDGEEQTSSASTNLVVQTFENMINGICMNSFIPPFIFHSIQEEIKKRQINTRLRFIKSIETALEEGLSEHEIQSIFSSILDRPFQKSDVQK